MDDQLDQLEGGRLLGRPALVDRRRVLALLGGLGASAVVVAACRSGSDAGGTTTTTSSTTGASTTSTAAAGASCALIPEETAGPYPGDGSNGPNILTEDGVVRSDIRSSFGSATGVAEGVSLTIKLALLDRGNACAPLVGAAVYLWHCDREGRYSMYSQGVTDENYLRGVQAAGADGIVTFTSIFPGAYAGRWPHIHFEVYPSLAEATSAANRIATSQLALPEGTCDLVYATDGYTQSVRNLAQSSLATDNVFSDGANQQLATVTGSVDAGFVASLAVPV